MIGIYKITNKINGKSYIGQSNDIYRRWYSHTFIGLYRSESENNLMYKDMKKEGVDSFDFSILEECNEKDLNEKEIYYINKFDSFKNGYNLTIGGMGTRIHPQLSDESVKRIKEELKNTDRPIMEIANEFSTSHQNIYDIKNGKMFFDKEEKYPLRKNKEKEKNYCIDCGVEISRGATRCKKCNAIHNRSVKRPDADVLMSEVAENGTTKIREKYSISLTTLRKWLREYNLPTTHNQIVEIYNKINGIVENKIHHNVTITSVVNNKTGKKVVQYKDGKKINSFDSCCEAARALGDINYNRHISEACRQLRKTAYGYAWRYE